MFKSALFYIIGLLIATLGIALVLKSFVGAGPWDAVFTGAYENFGLTIGTWSIIVQIIVVIFNAILLKKRPLYESGVTILVRGLFLDFWLIFVFPNLSFELSSLFTQWSIYLIGTLLLGAGVGTYIVSKLPPTPVDAMMEALTEKFNLSLKVSRTIVELIAVVIALLLGGPVGFGTIIMAFTLGHIIQFFNKYTKILYEKL